MRPPNVLVLISHDTGRHLSPYGLTTVDTPNFARLAELSVTFDNAFSCAAHDTLGISVPPYLVDGKATQADLAALQGAVRTLDRGLGRILDLMAEQNLLNNTILVVTTDHGIAVPRAKAMLYDAGVGVFLFIRDPAGGGYCGTRATEWWPRYCATTATTPPASASDIWDGPGQFIAVHPEMT